MKRLDITDSTFNKNKNSYQKPVNVLKPLYGTEGSPPFYDPNDLHVHTWKRGILGLGDDPKVPTYANGKLTIKECVYCKICHLVKDQFKSTVGSNIDSVNDIILLEQPTVDDYLPVNINNLENNKETLIVHRALFEVPPKRSYEFINPTSNLFRKSEGIFNNYVMVRPDKTNGKTNDKLT